MNTYPRIATPYELPFKALIQPVPLLSSCKSVNLSVELENPPTKEIADDLNFAVMQFFNLAETGAMGGDAVKPWISTIKDTRGPHIVEQSVEWLLVECRIDERAIAILMNLFLPFTEKYSIKMVEIKIGDDNRACTPLTIDNEWFDPYPPQWEQIPFKLEIGDEIMDSIGIWVQFSEKLDNEQHEDIKNELISWVSVTIDKGVYAVAPELPKMESLSPDFPVFQDDSLEWLIDDFHTHSAAVDGLINVLAAIHYNIAPIVEVIIE